MADTSMQGRTCIVTGASSGIGRVTAVELARRGAVLGIVCRDRGRGEETLAEIAEKTGNRTVKLHLADLASQEAVRQVASELLATYPKIHLLVNNAGVINLKYSTSPDGIETVFAVNHLAYFLLTNLLLDRIKASAPARIVNVASDAHKFVRGMNWNDLGWQQGYKTMRVYGQSKLANILFTAELARRLEGTGVTANAVHPGPVATRFGQNNGAVATFLTKLMAPFFRTPEQGAQTSIHVATSPALDGVNGRYFANCREARPSRAAQDAAAAQRLWEISAKMTAPAA